MSAKVPVSRSSSEVLSFYDNQAGVCRSPDPSELICNPDRYVGAAPKSPDQGFYASSSLYGKSISLAQAGLGAFAEEGSGAAPKSLNPMDAVFYSVAPVALASNPGTAIVAGAAAVAACGGEGNAFDPPADTPDKPPVDDNPPTNPTDDPGGLGDPEAFGASACRAPIDLDAASDTKIATTCGDNHSPSDGLTPPGAGKVEVISPASATDRKSLQFPTFIFGNTTAPIRLSQLASSVDSPLVFVGFEPAGTTADLQGNNSWIQDSGIYSARHDQAVPADPIVTFFDPIDVKSEFGEVIQSPMANDGTKYTSEIQPNSPAAMLRMGDTLIVVNANKDLNSKGELDNWPMSIHSYTIAADGTLSEAKSLVLLGQYRPLALADLGDGRFGLLVKGALADQDNASSLLVFNSDFTSGLEGEVGNVIPLSDSSDPDQTMNFKASEAGGMGIVQIDGVPHALISNGDSGDGRGRVALVNLDKSAEVALNSRVKFHGVFETTDAQGGEDPNIAHAVVHPDNKRAFIVSEPIGGEILVRTLFLDPAAAEGAPQFGQSGELKRISVGGTIDPTRFGNVKAVLQADNLVVAVPGPGANPTTPGAYFRLPVGPIDGAQ